MNKTISTMIRKAHNALQYSYSPYSHFAVASCVCTDDDTLFTGVNVENAAYPISLCAEASAIAQMVSSGYKQIKSIVILANSNTLCPPCGACRQRIFEFATADTIIHLCDKDKVLQSATIKELLPLAFVFNPLSGFTHD